MTVHIRFETTKDIKNSVSDLVRLIGQDGNGRLKKGSNEVTKAAERGTAKMVVMAENVNPGELLAHIPLISKEKNIPFIYVEDQGFLAGDAGMGDNAKTAAIALMEYSKPAEEAFKAVLEECKKLN